MKWARADAAKGHAPGPNRQMPYTVLDIETTSRRPWQGELICAGIGTRAHRGKAGLERAAELLSRPGVVVCHTSFDLRWLGLAGLSLHPELQFHDTRVMAWLVQGSGNLALDDLCREWLGVTPPKYIRRVAGALTWNYTETPVPIEAAPWRQMKEYCESDLRVTARLYDVLREALERSGAWDRFLEREVPLARAILEMEINGLPFDQERCDALRDHVAEEIAEVAEDLVTTAGLPESFNLGSSAQVSDYVYGRGDVELKGRIPVDAAMSLLIKGVPKDRVVDELNDGPLLPEGFTVERAGRLWAHGHWTVQGRAAVQDTSWLSMTNRLDNDDAKEKRPSTSSMSMVLHNPDDEWIGDLVMHRELMKLHGSFLSRFEEYGTEGRLYGTINRCGTATGRFSSSEPNLQNIPAHGNYGAHVRGLFRGDLAVGDYSQLEQRVAAHLSLDENLLTAYRDDVDLYGLAAAVCFGGEASKHHPQRGLMKTGMLALQYGAGANRLSQLLRIDGTYPDATKDFAEDLIRKLHDVFPRFFAWREEVIERCIVDGYVETLGGRRRDFDFPRNWLKMRKGRIRSMGREEVRQTFGLERQAISTVGQGGAADVVADALVATRAALGSRSRLLLQVHDEIIVERLEDWDDSCLTDFRTACETGHGYELAVPLNFDCAEVDSWAGKGDEVVEGFEHAGQEGRSDGLHSRKASTRARERRAKK